MIFIYTYSLLLTPYSALKGLCRCLLVCCLWGSPVIAQPITIGSKNFTENVILGEVLRHLAQHAGQEAIHRQQLGGTQILWEALLRGDLDAYAEYTGTLTQEVLADLKLENNEALEEALKERGLLMSRPLGFNNTYALGMKPGLADSLGIIKISDLRDHPDLIFAFGNEFLDRGDGWPTLRNRYGLPQTNVSGLDHDLSYRGLESGNTHVIDLYSTDAEIAYYKLRVLEDDLNHFPVYNAIIVYRKDLMQRAPQVVDAFLTMEGRIPESDMVAMNARAKIDKIPEVRIAANFLASTLDIHIDVQEETMWDRLIKHTGAHLYLVIISLSAAILIAVPLGIVSACLPNFGQVVLAVVGVIQTIPSLALLVMMIPVVGIGGPPAILALFLYSLLPIVRNTYAGLTDIPGPLKESAQALGLPPAARLRLVELPMASQTIIAGIKTSAVINVGTATLGAIIGAGGFGQPILTGIRLADNGSILEGAIPAAVLALLAQGVFEVIERFFVPRGLRLKA